MLNLRLRSRGDPPITGQTSTVRRTRKRVRFLLSTAILIAAMLPIPAAAQVTHRGGPSSHAPVTIEHRHVEVIIEGQEAHTLVSDSNVDLTEGDIDAMAQAYLSSHGIASSSTLQSRGYVTCDRRTSIWKATFPTDAVVGRVQAECFGNYDRVQLTGTLRIAEAWSPDRQVAWGQKTSSRNFERMLVAPRAICDSSDIELWRARNEVQVRFHSGQRRHLPLRETSWYLHECSA